MGAGTAGRRVGASAGRKEDRRLLTGHGHYVAGVAVPGMPRGAFLRSGVARATILSEDACDLIVGAGRA